MTVARMHRQRYIKRNTNRPRFNRQRPIKRGGKDVGPATGATAGIPGSWTPAGADVPATAADVIAGRPKTVVASPATAWTSGQYVQTKVAGAPGRVTWTGTAWVGGAAPLSETFDVNTHTVAETQAYVDAHPDQADEVLAAEQAGQARVTLVSWLQGFISDRDEGHIP